MNLISYWLTIVCFAHMMYVITDGFDLGVGVLCFFRKKDYERDIMVNSIAPLWDGNETWILLGGASLYGAFPSAYAIIIELLTVPIIAMLIGLILRGVSFEFRFNAIKKHRFFWDYAFCIGSILATLS